MSNKGPEISGNDIADEIANSAHARRENLVRRACETMGWDYHQSPVLTGLRKAALAEAVVVGLDKLEEILDCIDTIKRERESVDPMIEWFFVLKTLCAQAYKLIDQLDSLAVESHPSLYAVGQRWKDEYREKLSRSPDSSFNSAG